MVTENKKSAFSTLATFAIAILTAGAVLAVPLKASAGTPEKAPASSDKTEKSCSGDKGCGGDKKEEKIADPAKKDKKCSAEMKCTADKKTAEDDEEEGEDDAAE